MCADALLFFYDHCHNHTRALSSPDSLETTHRWTRFKHEPVFLDSEEDEKQARQAQHRRKRETTINVSADVSDQNDGKEEERGRKDREKEMGELEVEGKGEGWTDGHVVFDELGDSTRIRDAQTTTVGVMCDKAADVNRWPHQFWMGSCSKLRDTREHHPRADAPPDPPFVLRGHRNFCNAWSKITGLVGQFTHPGVRRSPFFFF